MTYITAEDALASGTGTWRTFSCPNPDHKDEHPSARINVSTGKWVCMVCGAKGCDTKLEIPVEYVLERVKNLDFSSQVKPDSLLDIYQGLSDYWLTRFKRKTCEVYGFKRDIETDMPIYPLHSPEGDFLGIVRRQKESPKYIYPKNAKTSKLLFGYHLVPSHSKIVIVEGAPDVAALYEAGVHAVGTFGARLYPAQRRLIEALQPRLVMVAYDMDQAGYSGSHRAVRSLRGAGLLARRMGWPNYNDPGDMPVGIRREIFGVALDTREAVG